MLSFFKRLLSCKPDVSHQAYRNLVDAEGYGAASSMGGLHASLRELQAGLGSGRNLLIDRGGRGILVIGSNQKFLDWVSADFPDAYDRFFKR